MVSRPSSARYRYPADQHLPRPCGNRLVDLLDTAPLGRQQEQRLAVWSAEHAGEDRAFIFDPLQHLAALAEPRDRALWGIGTPAVSANIRSLNPDGAFGVHADAVEAKALSPYPPVGQAAIGGDVERDELYY